MIFCRFLTFLGAKKRGKERIEEIDERRCVLRRRGYQKEGKINEVKIFVSEK